MKCIPKLTLCSDIDGVPECHIARIWQREGFNPNAKSWKIDSPGFTTGKATNCCFELYEYPSHSRSGKTEIITPGTTKTIMWNIRSLKVSKENCAN